jgi:hypothetical protein
VNIILPPEKSYGKKKKEEKPSLPADQQREMYPTCRFKRLTAAGKI